MLFRSIRVAVDADCVECLWPHGPRRYRFAEIAAVTFGTSLLTRMVPQLRLHDGRQVDLVVPIQFCLEIKKGLDEFRARNAKSGPTGPETSRVA